MGLRSRGKIYFARRGGIYWYSRKTSSANMLNLFLINSYLTYLVARLVIDKENYAREQCIFIFLRGIQPLDSTKYIPYELKCRVVENNMPEFPTYLKFYKGRRLKTDLFQQIRVLTSGKKFKLHTFQTCSRVVQLIRSMPECAETAILEEGACDPPMTIDEMSELYRFETPLNLRLFDFLNYGNSIKNPGFIEKHLQFYSLFSDSFLGAANNTTLFNASKIMRILKPKESVEPGSVFFIHTWFFGAITEQFYELYAAFVFQMCKRYTDRTIYHRFHPAQCQISKNLVRKQFLANNVVFLEFPDTEPIEGYLFSAEPYTFIGSRSSVLCYAKRMGKEVDAALG
jgi:hypothetical protein